MYRTRKNQIILFAVVSIFVTLVMAGCALDTSRVWYQEGRTYQQTVRDYNISTAETIKSGSTNDNTSVTFDVYPPYWNLPPGDPIHYTLGAGGRDIAGVRYYIMKARGYNLVPVNQLPQSWLNYNLGQIAD